MERDRKKYADARRVARQAVRVAKDAWFLRKSLEAERGRQASVAMHQGHPAR